MQKRSHVAFMVTTKTSIRTRIYTQCSYTQKFKNSCYINFKIGKIYNRYSIEVDIKYHQGSKYLLFKISFRRVKIKDQRPKFQVSTADCKE